MTAIDLSNRLKGLVSTDIDLVFVETTTHIDTSSKIGNDFVFFRGQYNTLNRQREMNLITNDEYLLHLDKIRNSIIQRINQITDGDLYENGVIKNKTDKLMSLELVLDRDYDSFDVEEQETLLEIIKGALKLNGNIKVINRQRGSVKLIVEVTEEDYKKIRKGFMEGKIDEYDVVSIRNLGVVPGPSIKVPVSSAHELREVYNERGERISPVLPGTIRNFLIDIDGTICDDIPNEEPERMKTVLPYPDALTMLNKWYDEGHIIYFFTSRTDAHREITVDWLNKHGFKYHGIIFGKPRGGNYHWIDNHIVRATRFKGKFTDLVVKLYEAEVFSDETYVEKRDIQKGVQPVSEHSLEKKKK